MNTTWDNECRNLSPLIRAEIARLKANGCTKSPHNLYNLAFRNVRRRHP